MKWIGISGSWRTTCPELQSDLKREVSAFLDTGDGVVTGGALGVDYAATDIALERSPDGSQIKVFLPTNLEIYAAHYRKRAQEGVITSDQAEQLISQLIRVNELGSLVENNDQTVVNQTTYYLRDTEVVNASDGLVAFQVNASAGTQDTIEKAKQKGIPVKVFSYQVDLDN